LPIQAVLFDMFDTLMLIEKNHEFYTPSLERAYKLLVENGVKVKFAVFRDAYIKARDALYAEADAQLAEPHFDLRISNALRNLGYSSKVDSEVVTKATNAFCEGFMEYVCIDNDAARILEQLHGKYKLGIVSNFAIPECINRLLQKHDLERFFEVVMVSAVINKRKPSPVIFESALAQLNVNHKNAVFVGDTVEADIDGAKAVGMKAIYIERREQKMQNAIPDHTIKSLAELPMALEQC
jgi:putative hydrolase of the HAD superfamily